MKVQLLASHPNYTRLLHKPLADIPYSFERGTVALVLDFPMGWALRVLELFDKKERLHTVVYTQSERPEYLDCIASFQVSASVACSADDNVLLSALHAAAVGEKAFPFRSRLTMTERLITRCLLVGKSTREIAAHLFIAEKTVNSHISCILRELEVSSRAELITTLLTGEATPVEAPVEQAA